MSADKSPPSPIDNAALESDTSLPSNLPGSSKSQSLSLPTRQPDADLFTRLILKDTMDLERMYSPGHGQTSTSSIGTKTYRQIGAGTCGAVFDEPDTSYAFKIAKFDDGALGNDYVMHSRVLKGFPGLDIMLHIPLVYYFVAQFHTRWWDIYAGCFPSRYQDGHRSALCSDRIPPLPEKIRIKLIDKYCPDNLKVQARADPSNKDCLVRIYLGKRTSVDRVKPVSFFSLRNFNMHLNQFEE